MAIYTLGPSASRIAGSRRGSTFQRTATGFVIRHRVAPKQKRTDRQSTLKNALAANASRWRSLTGTNQGEWDAERFNYQRFDSLGNAYFMLPNQMQIGSNQNLVLAGITPIAQPVSSGAPAAPVIDTVDIDFSLSAADFTLVGDVVPANRTLKRFVTGPRSNGQGVPGLADFKLMDTISAGNPTSGNAWTAYNAIFPLSASDVGQFIYCQMVFIQNDTGQNSPEATAVGNVLA